MALVDLLSPTRETGPVWWAFFLLAPLLCLDTVFGEQACDYEGGWEHGVESGSTFPGFAYLLAAYGGLIDGIYGTGWDEMGWDGKGRDPKESRWEGM